MKTYTIESLTKILTAAGCEVREDGSKLWVTSTPCGHAGRYGYLVAADDVRDVTENITKRNGEISAIIRRER